MFVRCFISDCVSDEAAVEVVHSFSCSRGRCNQWCSNCQVLSYCGAVDVSWKLLLSSFWFLEIFWHHVAYHQAVTYRYIWWLDWFSPAAPYWSLFWWAALVSTPVTYHTQSCLCLSFITLCT